MTLLVSACLLGLPCRYDGASKPAPQVLALLEEHRLIPVCPEQMGGLPTPRPPAECRGNCVLNREGRDVTAEYARGAQFALELARLYGCQGAILKERSPSCGCGAIYDGSFSGTLVPGDGVTARLLKEHGIPVTGESRIESLFPEK